MASTSTLHSSLKATRRNACDNVCGTTLHTRMKTPKTPGGKGCSNVAKENSAPASRRIQSYKADGGQDQTWLTQGTAAENGYDGDGKPRTYTRPQRQHKQSTSVAVCVCLSVCLSVSLCEFVRRHVTVTLCTVLPLSPDLLIATDHTPDAFAFGSRLPQKRLPFDMVAERWWSGNR